jgi:GntP family gluconate:H+ symporter
MLTGTPLIVVFLITMAILFVLLIKFKFSATVGLVLASLFLGIASGMPLTKVASSINGGFGGTMTSLGLLLAFGGIFGLLLTESGGTEELAKAMLRKSGKKYDTLALNLTGFIISIPVFFGSAYIMLAPLLNSMSKITKKKITTYVIALYTGLLITHSMVPPTPGPVAVAGVLDANLGFVILYGCILGIIASLVCGWLLSGPVGNRIGKPYQETDEDGNVIEDHENRSEEELLARNPNAPSAGLVVALILFPAILICAGAIGTLFIKEGPVYEFLSFISNGTIALFFAMLLTGFCLRKYLISKGSVMQIIDKLTDKVGNVILVVGAGGVFGQVIKDTGLADSLVEIFSRYNMPVLILAFLLTLIIRASVGSATVSMLTAASIVGPGALALGYSPVVLTMIICAGSMGLCIPTDGGFWIVSRMSNLDMKESLISVSLISTITCILLFILAMILNAFTGVLPGL